MMTRNDTIQQFLHLHGLGEAPRRQIAGDASFRRYERITLPEGASLVLMDAPPSMEDVRPFLSVQSCLWRAGYSVPEVIQEDKEQGLLLLEDWGDGSFTRLLAEAPERESAFYLAAVEALASLHEAGVAIADGASVPLPSYDLALLEREASLLGAWFLPLVMERERAEEVAEQFMACLRALLGAQNLTPEVLVHRDFHADNLFWLEGRAPAVRQVGMLDFQDAVLGRSAYDLVSLLEDARRDVHPDVVAASLAHYTALTEADSEALAAEYALYGAQRNAKILGIFARLCLRDGKPRYLSLIPRVWAHFLRDVAHPALRPLAAWVKDSFTEEDVALIVSSDLAHRAQGVERARA